MFWAKNSISLKLLYIQSIYIKQTLNTFGYWNNPQLCIIFNLLLFSSSPQTIERSEAMDKKILAYIYLRFIVHVNCTISHVLHIVVVNDMYGEFGYVFLVVLWSGQLDIKLPLKIFFQKTYC